MIISSKKYWYPRTVQVMIIDSRTASVVSGVVITINGLLVSYTMSPDCKLYYFSLDGTSDSMTISVSAPGYTTNTSTQLYSTLNKGTIQLVLDINAIDFAVNWSTELGSIDFDSHLLVTPQGGTKQEAYYSNKNLDFSPDITVALNRDDTTGALGENTEVTILDTSTYKNYTYVFVLYNWTNKTSATTQFYDRNAKVVVTYDKQTYTFNPTLGLTGLFWEICKIENGVFTSLNNITSVNNFGITS